MIYDLIIIGGGPAGYLAAERAGQAGMRVLLCEKRSLGGVCLNEGCIPTKTLLYSAKLLDGARQGEKYGVNAEGLSLDHAQVLRRKNKVVKTLVTGVRGALKAQGVTLLEAEARITGREGTGYEIEAGGEKYAGKRLLIATGSVPALAPIPGLAEGLSSGFVLTNREALELPGVPEKLVIIGGGVIGLEMASYYNSAGSQVQVIEAMDHIAGQNDPEICGILQKNYEKKGVTFLLSCNVTKIEDGLVHYQTAEGEIKTIAAAKALLSIGRAPATAGIGLETIGLACSGRAIITDERMRTGLPGVFAAGDVNGRSMLAHTAYREAEVAVSAMLGVRDIMRYDAIPAVIYTNPEVGAVGETEGTARQKGLEIDVVKTTMRYAGRYVAENEGGDGICKLIVNRKLGTLVGAHIIANYASEFIFSAGMMIELGTRLDEIKKMVFPHPTVCEILREAVLQYNPAR